MIWRVGVLMALMAWLVPAAPAAAEGITRVTDTQGVICISNTPPGKAGPRRLAAASAPAGQNDPTALPETAATPAGEVRSAPIIQSAADAAQEISRLQVAATPGPKPERGAVAQPSPQASTAEAAPEIPENSSLPAVKKVAYEVPGEVTAPAPPVPAPLKKPEIASSGGIYRYRDSQGLLHITNTPPVADNPQTGSQQALSGTPPSPEPAARQLMPPSAGDPDPGLRRVTFDPEDSPDSSPFGPEPTLMPPDVVNNLPPGVVPAPLPEILLAPPETPVEPNVAPAPPSLATNAAPRNGNGIRRYWDKKGVLHIENVYAKLPQDAVPPVWHARAGPAAKKPAPVDEPPVPLPVANFLTAETGIEPALALKVDIAPNLAFKPALFLEGEGLEPPEPLQVAALAAREITTPGGIHRYRDAQGIWRIESVATSGLPPPYPSPQPDRLPQALLPASLNMSRGTAALNFPGRFDAGFSYNPGITAQRNRGGGLTITNLPPDLPREMSISAKEAMARVEPIIREAALACNLPPALIRAVIRAESNFVPWAVSPKGAMGLMQLMPGTAADLGVQDAFDPRENIYGGCRYLRDLLNSLGGSVPLALAAYNAGYRRVVNCGYRVPDIQETQQFLNRVINWYLEEEITTPLPST